MKTIIIDDIRGSEIEYITESGGIYEGLKTSYGEGVFKIKNKLLPLIKLLFKDRIRKGGNCGK